MTQSYKKTLHELTTAYTEAAEAVNSCCNVNNRTRSIMKGANSQLGDKMIQAISIALVEYKKCEKAIYQMHRAVDARRQSSYPYRR
jgi:hypothetical protein